MKTITILPENQSFELSERATRFILEADQIKSLIEEEAARLEHVRRCTPLTQQEKDLRSFLGKERYNALTPAERDRMLESME